MQTSALAETASGIEIATANTNATNSDRRKIRTIFAPYI